MAKCLLIIIAGWGYPADSLAGLCRALAAGVKVAPVAADELGARGRSAPGLSGYAAGLIELIRERGGRAALAGWSMGGLVVLEVAARHPELVDRLALVACTPRFCSSADFPWGTPAAKVRAMRVGLRRDPEKTLAGFYRLAAAPFPEPTAVPDPGPGGREGLTAGLDYLVQTDLRACLKLVRAPALVLHGREDRVIPWSGAEYMRRELPASRLSLFAGIGHDLPLRDPERVAGDILKFLE